MRFWLANIAVLLLNIPQFHLASTSKSRSTSPKLHCYENSDYSGDQVIAKAYIPKLVDYSFNERISSCCVTGVWILYSETDYNARKPGGDIWYVYGDNYCTALPYGFRNQASSLRLAGTPDGWQYETINFYKEEKFVGKESFTCEDNRRFKHDIRSLIVTGCDKWTLYSEPNYSGSSVCVQNGSPTKCTPGFYSALRGFTKVGSVRRGCYAARDLLPDKY